jgi:hypothetical protein
LPDHRHFARSPAFCQITGILPERRRLAGFGLF